MRSALRRSLAAGLIAALFGLLGRAQPDGAAPKIAILEASPGKVSQGDGQIVDEPIGISTWMGLYQDGDAYRWRTTQVRINWAKDWIGADADPVSPGTMSYNPITHKRSSVSTKTYGWTGKHVSAIGEKDAPVIFVQGIPDLASVAVVSASYSKRKPVPSDPSVLGDLDWKKPLKILFAGKTYLLTEEPSPRNPDKEFQLVLSCEGIRQVIDTTNFLNDPNWSLIWAGDLDGDRRLDLLISYSDEGSARTELLLSSHAKADPFVRRVAVREWEGC